MERLTPYELSVLMHHYVSPEPYSFGIESGLYAETINKFFDFGVVVVARTADSEAPTRLTDLGKAWCRAILSTPLPRSVFVDSNDNIIE